ncbi:hypothetical protein [Kineosporia sp. R_H_3]|uniref:hypothetical protein n=1 Tax=Kineosporia sp. R_H_3 TaxID=1961848 RepID=UPI001179E4E1|nr:hypothetical protein [Kineosporia sp. R_H_3]
MGAGSPAGAVYVPMKAKAKHPVAMGLTRWVLKRVVLVATVWPAWTVAVAGGLAVAGWAGLLVRGLHWMAAAVPVLPLLAVAIYAAARWRRVAMADAWADLWLRLADDVKDSAGKVTERAVLPGSRLVRPRGQRRLVQLVHEDGLLREIVLTVRLGRTAQTVDHVRKAIGVIAAVYLTYGDCVAVAEASHKGEAEVRITTAVWADREREQREARVGQTVVWDRPTLDVAKGTIEPAVVLADFSPALLDLWTPGWGARRIWIAGESGSGKTYGLNDILLDACTAGVVVPHIIDLEDGPTLAGWEKYAASYATTIADAVELLDGLMAEHEARKPLLKRLSREMGVDVIPPSRENPVHLPVIDGGPRAVRTDPFMDRIRVAAFEWRKFLMGLIWVSQPGTAEAAFGNADRGGTALRDQFNVRIGFRAGAQTSTAMFDDHSLLPSISVSTPGVAFLQSPTHPVPTPVRFKYQQDAEALRRQHLDVPTWERPAGGFVAPAAGPVEAWPRAATASPQDSGERAVVRDDVPAAGEPGYLRDPDPEARIRGVLHARGPMTAKEIQVATRLSESRVYELLPRMRGLTKDKRYGGRWSLEQKVGS